MTAPQKLTKKQKKALTFRERKGKGRAKGLNEDNDVPVEENQDIVEAEIPTHVVENKAGDKELRRQGDSQNEKMVESREFAKKRRREDDEKEKGVEKPRPKKRKGLDNEEGNTGFDVEAEADQVGNGEQNETKMKQRYILFVGNLKYTTTREAVQKHFAACDPPPTVRLMTSKPSSSAKATTKSKGFAFLEFTHRNALQQALKLHQSELEGRMINVELTAGGGGKSQSRIERVKQRNRQLHEQRQKRLEKQHGLKDGQEGQAEVARPQRYSSTSGVDQAPTKKRTWTIEEPIDEKNGGGGKRSKKKTRPPWTLGTGVNAIPVG
ncbi:hypothetical protein AcW2_000623 [Taiwanofungus camphoratus]|nr:hypothetical protein AcW2_000623 [Antrodia cinnamomea]